MKKSIVAILILLVLAGLVFVRFRWLRAGVGLKEARFLEKALQNAVLTIGDTEMAFAIADRREDAGAYHFSK